MKRKRTLSLWWYVTRRSLVTNEPTYSRVLLVGPFTKQKEAAPYCERVRSAALAGHPIGGFQGHESIGIERLRESKPGVCNAGFGLPIEPANPLDQPETTAAVQSRLRSVPLSLDGFEVWDGSEADCLALVAVKGLKVLGGRQRSHAVPGSFPDLHSDAAGPDFFYYELADGAGRTWGNRKGLATVPDTAPAAFARMAGTG